MIEFVKYLDEVSNWFTKVSLQFFKFSEKVDKILLYPPLILKDSYELIPFSNIIRSKLPKPDPNISF